MPTVLYTVLYLAIVWAGPRIMKNREAFRLTWALIPYNLSMAALNFYIASEVSDQCNTERDNNRHSGTIKAYIYGCDSWSFTTRRVHSVIISISGHNQDRLTEGYHM
jgi:hypothetical protein